MKAGRLVAAALAVSLLAAVPTVHGTKFARAGAATPAALGRIAVDLLSRANYRTLEKYTCAPGGLAFSPYVKNLEKLQVLKLSSEELKDFSTSRRKYVWGKYDGSGDDIDLTPSQYHKQFIYDSDYRTLASNAIRSQAQLTGDSEFSALVQAFPTSSLVIYRYAGSRRFAFKDARELILIVRQADGQWCLEGLGHSEDTV